MREPDEIAASGGVLRATRMGALRRRLSALADTLLPPLCLGCHEPLASGEALCPACWSRIDFIRPPLCDRLGLPMPFDMGGVMVSAAAAAHPPAYDRARAVAHHSGLMRDLVHDLKFRDRHEARTLFGRWLAEAGRELLPGADALIPIPLGRLRLMQRRYNQAAILAQEVSRRTGLPTLPLALVRRRRTVPQVGLTRRERRRNVAGAFAVPPRAVDLVRDRHIVLVDDVITTGATAEAAAAALKRAGARRVDMLALALVAETADLPP